MDERWGRRDPRPVSSSSCDAHARYVGGCEDCRRDKRAYFAAVRQKRRQDAGTHDAHAMPAYQPPDRTPAQQAHYEALVAALKANLQVAPEDDLTRRCEAVLRSYHGPDIEVRPKRLVSTTKR